MRLEMNEEAGLTIFFTTLILISGIISLGGCHIVESTKQQAIKAGLVQKNEAAGTMQVWTKP